MWTISKLDNEFITRMENLLDLYERQYNPREPVVCLDERPLQLLGDVRKRIPARPGQEARYDYEYFRNGTVNVFCTVEPLAGKHFTKVTPDRGGLQFALMMRDVANRYPRADTIHLVLDNLNTHQQKFLIEHLGPKRGARLWKRFTIHYTPKHGSWLNQAEIEISLFNRLCMGRRRIHVIWDLLRDVEAWDCYANENRIKINWRFTTKKAREKFDYESLASTRSED